MAARYRILSSMCTSAKNLLFKEVPILEVHNIHWKALKKATLLALFGGGLSIVNGESCSKLEQSKEIVAGMLEKYRAMRILSQSREKVQQQT